MPAKTRVTAEHERLADPTQAIVPPWRRWGCYVTERAWGTVREDYSANGDAWSFLPHDQARSKAYRWGEDGIAGLCDRYQLLVFALALWNGRDPILKERLFGLSGPQGNHGEDVKEQYFYLDSTPTHSYMKFLYKYPQSAFPYAHLVEETARRGRTDPEFELLDTGAFDNDRYFLPWRPVVVSPIGIRPFFSEWGLRVIESELLWIWLPCLIFIAVVGIARRRIRHFSRR